MSFTIEKKKTKTEREILNNFRDEEKATTYKFYEKKKYNILVVKQYKN